MKKIRFQTRFNYFLGFCFLLFTCAVQSVQSQGFFTPTDHGQASWKTRFEIFPDGYKAKISYAHPIADVVYFFGTLQLDAAGHEIAWDSVYQGSGPNGPAFDWLPDDDLLEYGPYLGGSLNWIVQKWRLDGSLVWSHLFVPTLTDQQIVSVPQNTAGEIFLLGYEYNSKETGGAAQMVLRKIGDNGAILWTKTEALPDSSGANFTFAPSLDGGCIYGALIYGNGPFKTTLNKVSTSGDILWSMPIPYFSLEQIVENNSGDIYCCALNYDSTLQVYPPIIEKRDASGQPIWSKDISQDFSFFSNMALAENGDLLVIGKKKFGNQSYLNYFARYDPDGHQLWQRHYSFLSEQWGGDVTGIRATPDNGFILGTLIPETRTVGIIKMDANGNVYPGSVTGKLALDNNLSCQIDSSEQALANWKVQLKSPIYALYATTDSSGRYEMTDVPGDDYLLAAITPSSLWESCAGEVPIAVPDTGTINIEQDLPIQVLEDCPFMTIDIGTPALRRCRTNSYSVHYCNLGTQAADSASIQILLDPLLEFNAASIPHTQIGNTLHFSLGAVQSLECGDFTFQVTVNCDSTQLGQTLCVNASIFPDTICNPPPNWTGALLEGSGECLGDSVRFQLRNIGIAPSSTGLNSFVVDEHVIMFQQPIPTLPPNGTHTMTFPSNGTAYRLLADQEPNAPGMEMPSIGVEGCGTGGPSWGFLLQFHNRDGNPFTDRDCHEVVGSYDPNDKQAFPIGAKTQHYIEPNEPLEYQIRFQNTGTDTAFTVVVKDTLSAWLDPATIRPGAASHPYSWSLSGEGILTFTFEHILLPDSNTNEVASHGFVQFAISQKKDLPLGTVLTNRAGIYFDFNAPVMTNTVFHTIGHNFLTSATHAPVGKPNGLQVWPNPATESITVWAEKPFKTGQRLVLRNALGQVVREIMVQGKRVEIRRAGLSAGVYFLECAGLGAGKIIWE